MTDNVGPTVAEAEASLTPAQQAQLQTMVAEMLAEDNSQLTQQQLHSRQVIAAQAAAPSSQ
jgi:hypothetical protein